MNYFDPAMAPFTIALLIVLMIAALELAGALFGVAISSVAEQFLPESLGHADAVVGSEGGADATDGIGKFFAWLYVGKVPALMLLAAFLASFGVTGAVLQAGALAVSGGALPLLVAAPTAFAAALPATRAIGKALARFLPKETTDAVSTAAFIGGIATIFRGEARPGKPAEAKLTDAHGATHYILIEPANQSDVFVNGAEVMITEQSGAIFKGVANTALSLSVRKKGDRNA